MHPEDLGEDQYDRIPPGSGGTGLIDRKLEIAAGDFPFGRFKSLGGGWKDAAN